MTDSKPYKQRSRGASPSKPSNIDEKKSFINGQATTPVRFRDSNIGVQEGKTVYTNIGTIRFLPKKTGDETLPYYHGLLPREDIRQMLRVNGDFLLRTTELEAGKSRQKCLSMMWQCAIRHFILNPSSNGKYSFDPTNKNTHLFETIGELVKYYCETKQPFSRFNAQLLNPINRLPWEFRHSQVELDKKLGEGAFGEVLSGFLYIKKNKKIKVAIKTLKCTLVNKKKIEEAMLEARLLRSVRHRNVVRLYGVAADEEPLMILMELVKGGGLDTYLDKQKFEITIGERARMAQDASIGIEYIHSLGIIHRDIAARNCLYSKDSESGGVLKLSDFGLSRYGPVVEASPSERVPVRWVAPEVFTTMKYTAASDVWALGVLIWEIYNNGQEPYTGWSPAQVRMEVVQNRYTLPMPEWCDERIKDLIKNIWTYDPQQRIHISKVVDIFETIQPRRKATDTTSSASNVTYVENAKYLKSKNDVEFDDSPRDSDSNDSKLRSVSGKKKNKKSHRLNSLAEKHSSIHHKKHANKVHRKKNGSSKHNFADIEPSPKLKHRPKKHNKAQKKDYDDSSKKNQKKSQIKKSDKLFSL